MYIVSAGFLDCYSDLEENVEVSSLGAGCAIGDVGYIGGYRARASIVARTRVQALVISDDLFSKIEDEDRKAAVDFRRFLGTVTNERASPNSTLAAFSPAADYEGINVLLCGDDKMLLEAMKLRYAIDCDELGRNPPEADHSRRIITDRLDEFGHTFVAVERGQVIGTLRTNLAREGSLGIIEDLFGMSRSPDHPAKTAVCMKFYIKKSKRRSAAFLQLGRAWLQDAMNRGIGQCFVVAVPSLAAAYKLLGFRSAAERFYHHGNGPSEPMVLDVQRHANMLGGLAGLHA
jgi:hypothetical protein